MTFNLISKSMPTILFFLLSYSFSSSAEVVQQPHIAVELVSAFESIEPGQVFEVGLYQKIDPHWHTYWQNAGDSGQEVRIKWQLPDGFQVSEILWPIPKRIEVGPLTNFGYENEVLLMSRIQAPQDLKPGTSLQIGAEAKWLVCEKTCIPGKAQLRLPMKVSQKAKVNTRWQHFFKSTLQTVPQVVESNNDSIHWELVDQDKRILINIKDWKKHFVQAQIQQLDFFPITTGLTTNGQDFRFEESGTDLLLHLNKNQFFKKKSEEFRFVLSHAQELKEFHANMPVTASASTETRNNTVNATAFFTLAFWQTLLFALLGGLILNLMPCVFPVLSIKILGLVKKSQSQNKVMQRHGLIYLAGVISTFLILAISLIVLRAGGEKLGWGFQLQSPGFLMILISLIFAMALSFSGFYELGSGIIGLGQRSSERSGYSGTFFTGMLSVVAATPCTAPFMGSAIGYAFSQNTFILLMTFIFLGLGMALPYVLLCFYPQWIQRLPKPGLWMDQLKQFLAFPLYLTCLWLLWILGKIAGPDAMTNNLIVLICIVFLIWLSKREQLKSIAMSLTLVILMIGALLWGLQKVRHNHASYLQKNLTQQEDESISYGIFKATPFSQTRLAEAQRKGQRTFVSFTADWCITCKANERITFHSLELKEHFTANNILLMVADWTQPNAEIASTLESHGRNGIPLYLYYPESGPTKILPEIITAQIILKNTP